MQMLMRIKDILTRVFTLKRSARSRVTSPSSSLWQLCDLEQGCQLAFGLQVIQEALAISGSRPVTLILRLADGALYQMPIPDLSAYTFQVVSPTTNTLEPITYRDCVPLARKH